MWVLFCLYSLIGSAFTNSASSSYQFNGPSNGSFAFPHWQIVVNSRITSLEDSLCGTNSYSGALMLSTRCIGGLNALSHSFFRSHIPRHDYMMQHDERLNEYQILFRIYYTVRLDFSLVFMNWQHWAPLLLSPSVSSIVNKFEGITFRVHNIITGIPWSEEIVEISFVLSRLKYLMDLSTSETPTTVELDSMSPLLHTNFTVAWDVLRDGLVSLEDVHQKPTSHLDVSFSNEDLSEVLLSLHVSVQCSLCSDNEIDRVFGNQTAKDSFFHQIQVHINDFRIQYIPSSPGKVIFPSLKPINYEDALQQHRRAILNSMNEFPAELRDNPCLLKDKFPEEANILDHIHYQTDFHPFSLVDSQQPSLPPTVSDKLPRVLCSIYSTTKSHGTKLAAIKATWGRKCTAFLVFSTSSDPTLPAIHVPHIGDEHYGNMWQKARAIWRYLYTYYLRQFDFFLLGGDDMYYIMENLYAYLDKVSRTPDHEGLLYLGRTIRYHESNDEHILQSGGAGYLLSQQILSRLFAKKLPMKFKTHSDVGEEVRLVSYFDYHASCTPTTRTSSEDSHLAQCLRALGVRVFDTSHRVTTLRNSNNNETLVQDRFHFLAPAHLAYFNATAYANSWVTKLPWNPVLPKHLGVSPESVSFHYIRATQMYMINAYLYACPRRTFKPLE